jgi:hypothetical protein
LLLLPHQRTDRKSSIMILYIQFRSCRCLYQEHPHVANQRLACRNSFTMVFFSSPLWRIIKLAQHCCADFTCTSHINWPRRARFVDGWNPDHVMILDGLPRLCLLMLTSRKPRITTFQPPRSKSILLHFYPHTNGTTAGSYSVIPC